jgi:hypothetical protein
LDNCKAATNITAAALIRIKYILALWFSIIFGLMTDMMIVKIIEKGSDMMVEVIPTLAEKA